MTMTLFVFFTAVTVLGTLTSAASPPSSVEKYRAALGTSKLQFKSSSDGPDITSANLLNGYANWFFYLDSSNKMTFKMNGADRRSELRQMQSGGTAEAAWTVDTSHKLVANIAIPTTPAGINELTILQIHCNEDVPAIRISYVKSITIDGTTYSNAIIATRRDGFEKSSDDTKFFLRSTHTSFAWYTLRVSSKKLDIWVNSAHKSIDLSVWDGKSCYFKAGAYINNPSSEWASGISRFDALTWY